MNAMAKSFVLYVRHLPMLHLILRFRLKSLALTYRIQRIVAVSCFSQVERSQMRKCNWMI